MGQAVVERRAAGALSWKDGELIPASMGGWGEERGSPGADPRLWCGPAHGSGWRVNNHLSVCKMM